MNLTILQIQCPHCHLMTPLAVLAGDLDDFTPTRDGRAVERQAQCPSCSAGVMLRLTTKWETAR